MDDYRERILSRTLMRRFMRAFLHPLYSRLRRQKIYGQAPADQD